MKKRINLTLLIVILLSINSFAQNIHFIKSYGNSGYDYGRDIKQDLDTGYIATGSSSSFSSGTADAFLLKVDSLGNFKWSYNYGGQGTDWGESVVITNDSSYAIGGYTNSVGAGGFDFYLVRADKDGTPLWEKTYGGSDWDRAHSIIQLADSGFVLVGDTYSYGNGNADIYIVRTDKDGDTLWTTTYGGNENDFGNAVILDGDSLVIAGGTESFGNGMSDGIILKYHIDGTFGWSKVVGENKEDYFTSIAISDAQKYLLGGSKDYGHYMDCDCGQNFWLYETDELGNLIIDGGWQGENIGTEIVYDVVFQTNIAYIFGGITSSWGTASSQSGDEDLYLGKKLSANGNQFYSPFTEVFGHNESDELLAIDLTYDNGIIGIGNLNYKSTGGASLIIVKVKENNTPGNIVVQNDLELENITLSYQELITNPTLKIYPTLFTNSITLEELPGKNTIKIYSNTGKLVFTSVNEKLNSLDLSYFSNGLYIINIQTEKHSFSHKIIKN